MRSRWIVVGGREDTKVRIMTTIFFSPTNITVQSNNIDELGYFTWAEQFLMNFFHHQTIRVMMIKKKFLGGFHRVLAFLAVSDSTHSAFSIEELFDFFIIGSFNLTFLEYLVYLLTHIFRVFVFGNFLFSIYLVTKCLLYCYFPSSGVWHFSAVFLTMFFAISVVIYSFHFCALCQINATCADCIMFFWALPLILNAPLTIYLGND